MGTKEVLTAIGKTAAGVLTGGVSDRIFDIIEQKVSPDAWKEIQAARYASEAEIRKAEADRDARVMEAYGKVLEQEAVSDSTLAKTARPGGVWTLTLIMAVNFLLPGLVNFFIWIFRQDPARLMPYPEIPYGEMLIISWLGALGIYGWYRTQEKKARANGRDVHS